MAAPMDTGSGAERTDSESEPQRPISRARGFFALIVGLALLSVFGMIFVDVVRTAIAAGMGEPASLVLAVFSFVLAGLGAGLTAIGYQRLTGRNRALKRQQLPVWLLFALGGLFIVAGAYGLLVRSFLWGAITLVLGVSACKLAWRRRGERRA